MSVRVSVGHGQPDLRPFAPQVSATPVSSSRIDLTWPALFSAASYRVHVSTVPGFTPGPSNLVGVLTEPNVSLTGLSAATNYRIRVVAVNPFGSAMSAEVSATTQAAGAIHPNEPVEFTAGTEHTFAAAEEDGWVLNDGYSGGPRFSIGVDASAPMSPSAIGVITYEEGFSAGGATPAQIARSIGPASDVYFHLAVFFDANWQGHQSGVNKIMYLVAAGTGSGGDPCFFVARGAGTNTLYFEPRVQGSPEGTYNLNYDRVDNGANPAAGDVVIARGGWTDLEVLVRGNTSGVADGEIHAWVNGVKTHEFTGLELLSPGSRFDNLRWEPVWGGQGTTPVAQEMVMAMDHIYASVA